MSTGASRGTSATEGNCEKGIGASVDKSGVVPCCDGGSADKFGVVPCCDGGSADKSGELAVACCDVPCGDATKVKGALPRRTHDLLHSPKPAHLVSGFLSQARHQRSV